MGAGLQVEKVEHSQLEYFNFTEKKNRPTQTVLNCGGENNALLFFCKNKNKNLE